MSTREIPNPYGELFNIVPALTEELKNEAFKIRHSVYCEDLGYEPVTHTGMEKDEYDACALHLLIEHKLLKRYIGTVRLIVNNHLPMFEHYEGNILNLETTNKHAEISRLAVIHEFRQRKDEIKKPDGLTDGSFYERRHDQSRLEPEHYTRFPYIPLGLYMGIVAWALTEDIKTLYLLSEPRLAEHFAKLGVAINQIGPAVEHRGERRPYIIKPETIISDMRKFFVPLYQKVEAQIKDALT